MNTLNILKASEYLGKEHKIFSYIVSKAYEITEESDKDYKERFTWSLISISYGGRTLIDTIS